MPKDDLAARGQKARDEIAAWTPEHRATVRIEGPVEPFEIDDKPDWSYDGTTCGVVKLREKK